MASGVEYLYPYDLFFLLDVHLNPLLAVGIVDGVADIVGQHLFRLKFIRPYVFRPFPIQAQGNAILFSQDSRGLDDALCQFHQVKTFKYYLLAAGFQLVQRQQVLHKLIHLVRLVHNDLTVKFPAGLILVDAFLQPFRIALD